VSLSGLGFVVAGGATACGHAVAVAAARRGAQVVASGGSQEASARLSELTDGRATGVVADPALEADAERLFGAAVARLPRIDVVVSAAPGLPVRAFSELTLSEWEGGVARALRGAFFVSRLAVEEFLARGAEGRIVHIAPEPRPGPGLAMAAVSLEALLSLVRSTAKEYGPRGICCNAVVHSGHAGAEVVESALFLASSEASYVNGEALRVGASIAR
jgi:NAD(P)-dependent dehydrogenase (short-subunit alcohol dehydrogenase family)